MVQAAFAEYTGTIPVPPGALGDNVDDFRAALAEGRTVLAFVGDVEFTDGTLDFSRATPVGTARYEPREDHLYVGRVAVHPNFRRQGIGEELMAYIERVAPTIGYNKLYLGTRASMPGNLAFYEKLGYRVVKEEPHPRGPDVNIWFEKELD